MAEQGNLLQNRLFLSYLSGAGTALSRGEPAGPALDVITQKNIAAQSKETLQMKYLKMLLGEGVDFRSDEKGVATVKGDLGKVLGGSELGTVAPTPTPTPTPDQQRTDELPGGPGFLTLPLVCQVVPTWLG